MYQQKEGINNDIVVVCKLSCSHGAGEPRIILIDNTNILGNTNNDVVRT